MFVVLAKWVLKSIRFFIEFLRPLGLFFVTEDPAFVVFGFYNEDAVFGYEDVIDLRSV